MVIGVLVDSVVYWWLGPYFWTHTYKLIQTLPLFGPFFQYYLSCVNVRVCFETSSAFIAPGSWDNPMTFIRESNGICKPSGPDFTSFSDLNLWYHKETVCEIWWERKCVWATKTFCMFATKLKPLTHEMKIFGWSWYLGGYCFNETSFIKFCKGPKKNGPTFSKWPLLLGYSLLPTYLGLLLWWFSDSNVIPRHWTY